MKGKKIEDVRVRSRSSSRTASARSAAWGAALLPPLVTPRRVATRRRRRRRTRRRRRRRLPSLHRRRRKTSASAETSSGTSDPHSNNLNGCICNKRVNKVIISYVATVWIIEIITSSLSGEPVSSPLQRPPPGCLACRRQLQGSRLLCPPAGPRKLKSYP